MKSRTHDVGIYRPRHSWTFSPTVRFRSAAKDRRLMIAPGRADAAALATRCAAAGKTIVFTNGVFDLLHPGHLRYLQQARRSATR